MVRGGGIRRCEECNFVMGGASLVAVAVVQLGDVVWLGSENDEDRIELEIKSSKYN